MSLRRCYLAACLLAAPPAFAAGDGTVIFPGNSLAGGTTDGSSSAGGMPGAFTLLLAAALALVGGWLFWRNRSARSGGREVRLLAVDETRPLGNRQYLVVASYDGKKFLLGVCPGRIELLSPLTGAPTKETTGA